MRIDPAAHLAGHVAVPGDKSISHRAVLLGAIAEGETRVTGFGRSADTEATVRAMRALGAEVSDVAVDELVVRGVGLRGLRGGSVDCANAGTLMRLLAGVAAGQGETVDLTGDESLMQRPMERIGEPLRRMGARVETTDGHAPLRIEPAEALRGIHYELPVASAQVKSAILLAGLYASGRTTVVEPSPTRDHTERMLEGAGAAVRRGASSVTVEAADTLRLGEVKVPGEFSLAAARRGASSVTVEAADTLRLGEVTVPGDFSSAAPLLVAAALVPGSDLTVHDVGLNPRRTGLLDVLERMGARVAVFNRRGAGREPVGDVQVQASELSAVDVGPAEVPGLVDELPLVALLASHARGESVVRGARELRVKESDRIEAVTEGLRACGARIRSRDDGWTITGVPARLRGGRLDARGDHRIAMLGAVAGLASREGVEVGGADTVAISFPGFFELLDSVVRR